MEILKGLGGKVPTDLTIDDVNNWVIAKILLNEKRDENPTPLKRHTQAADQQAFDKLYEATQEIAEITRRAIREGRSDNGRGYKKIRAILERVE